MNPLSEIPHPFLPGTKVARILLNLYGHGTGKIDRSEVQMVISKGARAGKFRVLGWDGDHSAEMLNNRWQATSQGFYMGRVYLDDYFVAELERGFVFVEKNAAISALVREVETSLRTIARGATRETQDAIIALLDAASTMLKEPPR